MKMQNNKSNDNVSFIGIFLRTLSRVGNVLIIALGVIFFGIKKIFFAFKKDHKEQTLHEFVRNLEEHLDTSSKRFETRRKKGTKASFKQNMKDKTKITKKTDNKKLKAPQQPIYTQRNRNRYEPKKSGLLRLVQITLSLAVLGAVIFGIVVVVEGFLTKKNGITKDIVINSESASIYELKESSSYYSLLDELYLRENINSLMLEIYSEELLLLKEYQEQINLEEPVNKEPEVTPQVTQEVTQIIEVTPQPSSPSEIDPELMIHLDETYDIVAQIQEKLMDLNYMDHDEPTTYYGLMTEYAMQLFQRGHNLMVDGIAGYDTISLLFSEEAKPYLVRKGDKGWDIKQIQKRLTELGYLDDEKRDGRFDEDTDYAVRVFQGRNKLSQDGIIGYNTTQVLFNGDAKPASNYQPPSSGSSGDSSGGGSSDGGSYNANDASSYVAYAKSIMNKGYTYIWGGKGPPGMDCSGFVYYCLKQTGNGIGYMTSAAWAQSSYTTISSIHDAKPGDILCFQGHVAICIGDGKMIDSSSSSNAIRIANYETSAYWNRKWICAKRVFS